LSTSVFALMNGVFVVIWLLLAWRIGRTYRELSISGRPPESSALPVDALMRRLSGRLRHSPA